MNSIENNGRVHRIRQVGISDKEMMDTVADLHIKLLGFGPMAGLGPRFVREACYVNNMRDGGLSLAVYEVDDDVAGFVAYTDRSISFHRTSLRKHWFRTAVTLSLSLLSDPRRLVALYRALAVLGSRRGEQDVVGEDPMGEVVCIAVRPDYLTLDFKLPDGARPAQTLVSYAAAELRQRGVEEMRMLVDADNKAVLFLYRALGANFEPYSQAGEPMVQVWFGLDQLLAEHPCALRTKSC